MMKCGIKQSLRLQPCKHRRKHAWNSLTPEFINWIAFGTVWISLSVELSSQPKYCTNHSGGRLYTEPCNTLYAAYGLSIVLWVLFCISYAYVAVAMFRQAVDGIRRERGNSGSRSKNEEV